MIPLDTALVFFATALLLALAPGPDNIFVLTQSTLRGSRAGLVIMLGLCTGLLVHTSAVAFGVAAIFKASALAFTCLKIAGTCYLLFLAWQAFRAPAEDPQISPESRRSLLSLYRRGIVMNITNPKVSIFFLAFLPQFADPSRGSLTLQMLVLGVIFIAAAIIVFSLISFAAGAVGTYIRRVPSVQIYLNRIAGVIFVGLAAKLAVAKR